MNIKLLLTSTLYAAIGFPTALVAQQSNNSNNTEQTGSKYALEEVIVTAEKKSESLQDTPISLTAFSSERLETDGISNLSDIGSKVPSLTIEPFPINNATLRIFIRGIGISDAQLTQDPPVGIYIDGSYIARSTGTALDVADLERIEILRGPQGTLYGRNTTGGAINLITKRPDTEEFSFSQKFTSGSRNQFSSKTGVNIPFSENFAVKLAYLTSEKDGFIENTGPGEDFGDRDVEGARLDLRWNINDRLTLDYAYDKSEMEYVNTPYQAITRPTSDKGEAEPIKASAEAESKYSDSRFDSMATGMPMEASHTEIEGHSLTLTADFDSFQIKYMAAQRELFDASYADLGGGNGSTNYRVDSHIYDGLAATSIFGKNRTTPLGIPSVEQEQLSHELQISGDTGDGRVEYIVGAYYFEEQGKENDGPLHHQFSAGAVLGTHAVNFTKNRVEIDNEATALFGQATWTPAIVDDRLHLTFGARHSEDSRYAKLKKRDNAWAEVFLVPIQVEDTKIDAAVSKDFSDNSFSLVAEFDFNEDVNIYLKRVEAYKSGGFNTRDPQVDGNQGNASDGINYGFGFVDGFDSEEVLAYELGVKSEFLDRRLRINADVFQSIFSDMQLNFLLNGTLADTKITNAGEAEMRGVELDITFMATRSILLMLNYAYLDAEVTKARDIHGNDVSDDFVFFAAPPHSYTAAADWTLVDADWGRVTANLSYNYMGERNGGASAANVHRTRLEAYSLLNGRLSLADVSIGKLGQVTVSAWGKNLTDEEYSLTAVDNLPHADRAVLWGEPRSYGFDLIYNF